MTPNPSIPLALSREEWEDLCYLDAPDEGRDGEGLSVDIHAGILSLETHNYPAEPDDLWTLRERIDPERRHALAALCLHDQPFGFAPWDVDLLRHLAKTLPPEPAAVTHAQATLLRDLADRIAALLPPSQ